MVESAVSGMQGLVAAISAGDEAAFAHLVARHHRDLQRVAYAICRDPALAEDAAQSAWAIAWQRIGQLHDPDRLRSWLVAIAANEARMLVRSQSRRVKQIPVVDLERTAARAGPEATDDQIDRLDLRRALDALEPTDRALVALRFLGGLDSDEIGRALGMSPSGARGRLSRVLAQLREVLSDA